MKKFSTENPALQYLTENQAKETPKAEKTQTTQERIPEGYKLDPRYIETKSKKLQMLMQPSLYEAVKELADQHGDSVNNYIHVLLKKHVEEQGE